MAMLVSVDSRDAPSDFDESAPQKRVCFDGHYGPLRLDGRRTLAGPPGSRLPQLGLIRQIGRGGFGVVWLVEDLSGKRWALKVLHPAKAGNEQARQALRDEARIADELGNACGISQILPPVEVGQTSEGLPFYLMEYIDGGSLRDLLVRTGGTPLERSLILHIMENVTQALKHAHARNIRHRDLKPENILLSADGPDRTITTDSRVFLIDFGLASRHAGNRLAPERGGTSAYMAPEQRIGAKIPFTAEVYSLGVILHELLTGHRAWEGVAEHREKRIDVALLRIARKATANEPADRYEDVAAFQRDLRAQMDEPPEEYEQPEWLGSYRKLAWIGQGTYGDVYRAYAPNQDRMVAIKHLKAVSDPGVIRRFLREVEAMSRTDHPNLARIYAVDREFQRDFYVMDLIEGPSLRQVFHQLQRLAGQTRAVDLDVWKESVLRADEQRRAEERPAGASPTAGDDRLETCLPAPIASDRSSALDGRPAGLQQKIAAIRLRSDYIRHVVRLIRDAADAVDQLHRNGVFHRDLKLGNLMISEEGEKITVIDLGAAAIIDKRDQSRSFQPVGTEAYCAPELLRRCSEDGGVDGRADVYSLGVVLWELLTLQPLYASTADVWKDIDKPRPTARSISPSIPSDLSDIVAKCLEVERHDRYPTAGELRDQLDDFLAHRPVRVHQGGGWYRVRKQLRRHPKTWAASAVVAVLLLASCLATAAAWYGESIALENEMAARREAERAGAEEALALQRAREEGRKAKANGKVAHEQAVLLIKSHADLLGRLDDHLRGEMGRAELVEYILKRLKLDVEHAVGSLAEAGGRDVEMSRALGHLDQIIESFSSGQDYHDTPFANDDGSAMIKREPFVEAGAYVCYSRLYVAKDITAKLPNDPIGQLELARGRLRCGRLELRGHNADLALKHCEIALRQLELLYEQYLSANTDFRSVLQARDLFDNLVVMQISSYPVPKPCDTPVSVLRQGPLKLRAYEPYADAHGARDTSRKAYLGFQGSIDLTSTSQVRRMARTQITSRVAEKATSRRRVLQRLD